LEKGCGLRDLRLARVSCVSGATGGGTVLRWRRSVSEAQHDHGGVRAELGQNFAHGFAQVVELGLGVDEQVVKHERTSLAP